MIDIEVEDPAWIQALPEAEALVRQAAEAALTFAFPIYGEGGPSVEEPMVEGASPRPGTRSSPPPPRPLWGAVPLPRFAGETSLSVLLTDDASVRELNKRFRDKDTATNVLSFPAPANPEDHLGDVALGFGVCAREAAEQGKPLSHHLQHLTVHGVLHLLGYDHMGDDDAEAMEGLERAVLADLGIPDPYATGEGEHERS